MYAGERCRRRQRAWLHYNFKKTLRLYEAGRLLLTEPTSASSAAFSVGYQSVSQFSREYWRMFGTPPMQGILVALWQLVHFTMQIRLSRRTKRLQRELEMDQASPQFTVDGVKRHVATYVKPDCA